MLARRAARESAVMILSQIDGDIGKYKTEDFEELAVRSVRMLTNNAYEDLKTVASSVLEMRDYIDDYELRHPDNADKPLNSEYLPVPMPLTSDMSGRLAVLEDVCEKAFAALEIAEMAVLQEASETKKYTAKIIESYFRNHVEIDGLIKKYAKGWDFSRLIKTDRNILRIAIAEMLFVKETPVKVIIDEAVELAKRYSTEDSSSFINGILAKVTAENLDV